jgi:two-component system, NarL family, sensor kinase
MQIPETQIITGIVALTLIFFSVGAFLVSYVALHNSRKKQHVQEKELLKKTYDREIIQAQLEVQEQTLKNVASDIHDNVGQILALTKLTLTSIDEKSNIPQKINDCAALVDMSLTELRQLVRILHADNILTAGLYRAIENEVNWIRKAGKFNIELAATREPQYLLKQDAELVAFRLIQELLGNIIKHSDASDVKVIYDEGEVDVTIKVSDNGKGFDLPLARQQKTGLGISNLYARASLINGSFEMITQPSKGTQATLVIPLS